jgi:glycine/D-amino acid oxidase-like deaminating enzyme
VWFRPEGTGGKFIAGLSPAVGDPDPDCVSDDALSLPDHSMFQETIWPTLFNRVPAFEELKLKSTWAGFYELNTLDEVCMYINITL